jgi:hypothetical protein
MYVVVAGTQQPARTTGLRVTVGCTTVAAG